MSPSAGGFNGSFGFPQVRTSKIVLKDGSSISNVRVYVSVVGGNYVLELSNDAGGSWEEFTGSDGSVHTFGSGSSAGVMWRLTGNNVVFSRLRLWANVEV